MTKNDVAYLVDRISKMNQIGIHEVVETRKKVYCNMTSVTSKEWFEAGRNGMKPQLRMVIHKLCYHGEPEVEHKGVAYSVYRTYENGNEMELYLERKAGVS